MDTQHRCRHKDTTGGRPPPAQCVECDSIHREFVRAISIGEIEIEAHHRDLMERAFASGASAEEARREADMAIGSDDTLIERFASRKELQSLSHRFPVAYGFAPILCFGCLGVALMAAAGAAIHAIWPHPHDARVSAGLATDINIALILLFLWILPISLAMGFGVRGGPTPLFLEAGIGFGTKRLPQEFALAMGKAIPALIPLAWMKYRSSMKSRSESNQPSLS